MSNERKSGFERFIVPLIASLVAVLTSVSWGVEYKGRTAAFRIADEKTREVRQIALAFHYTATNCPEPKVRSP